VQGDNSLPHFPHHHLALVVLVPFVVSVNGSTSSLGLLIQRHIQSPQIHDVCFTLKVRIKGATSIPNNKPRRLSILEPVRESKLQDEGLRINAQVVHDGASIKVSDASLGRPVRIELVASTKASLPSKLIPTSLEGLGGQ